MRIIQILLCVIAIPLLIIGLYQFVNRYAEWQDSRVSKLHQQDKIDQLIKTRDELKRYIDELETNEFAQERLVRSLGYIKPGEVVYQIKTKQNMDQKKEDKSYLGGFIVE